MRISLCLLGIQQNMQPNGQQSNREQKTLALRRIFEVTDKYDIMSMNAFFTNEIVAQAPELNIPDLIAIGELYSNVKILDAGFGTLNRQSARKMLLNEQDVWMNYSLTTKDRLLAAVGNLL